MPPLQPVPKVLRVSQLLAWGVDLAMINRVFIEYAGSTPSSANLNTMASAINSTWPTDLGPLCNTQVELRGIEIEDLTSPSASVGSDLTAHPGTRSGASLPAGTAAVVQFRIARRYRGGHPRTYWPGGVIGDEATPQTWSGAYQSALLAAWTSWLASVTSSGWSGSGSLTQVNVSYYSGFTNVLYPSGRYRAVPTQRIPPLTDVITSVTINPIFASQRRRNEQP